MEYVIIGNGPAAVSAVEAIRRCDTEGSTTMPTATPNKATGNCHRWKAEERAVTDPSCR